MLPCDCQVTLSSFRSLLVHLICTLPSLGASPQTNLHPPSTPLPCTPCLPHHHQCLTLTPHCHPPLQFCNNESVQRRSPDAESFQIFVHLIQLILVQHTMRHRQWLIIRRSRRAPPTQLFYGLTIPIVTWEHFWQTIYIDWSPHCAFQCVAISFREKN